MPNAAIVGAALTTAGAHPWGLFLGGLDVIREPGGAMGLGVAAETIVVNEAGPGAVSSMAFTIDDPNKSLTTILAGTEVSYWDLVNNVCLFRGWVDHYGFSPDFGGQGRTIQVNCIGIEAILDWTIVPAGFTLFGQYSVAHATGLLAQNYAGNLRAPSIQPGMSSPPYTQAGSFTYPIGSLVRPAEPAQALEIAGLTWVSPGGTLRAAMQDFLNVAVWHNVALNVRTSEGIKALWTVDFYWGLRLWEDSATLQPDDYTTLTVTNTYAGGPPSAAGLDVQVDWTGVIRSVYVAGANAASSGLFSDGTGIYGPTTLVTDSNIASLDDAKSRAISVMAAQAAENRGSFVLEDFTPTPTVHAGSLVTITDAATSVADTFRIMEIRKTFRSSGRQDWTVNFGNLPAASVTRLTRRFTRTLLQ